MRPERHMLPKAACPARWVPEPETRGIRATARPGTKANQPLVFVVYIILSMCPPEVVA